MSLKETSGTRGYHPTNMPRRDPTSQAILNRHAGKDVVDDFSTHLPEMNPETAKHFAGASEAVKKVVDEVVPMMVKRMAELEVAQKQAETLSVKRDKEMNERFDAIMNVLAGGAKGKKPVKPAVKVDDDFQSDDDLPPSEK